MRPSRFLLKFFSLSAVLCVSFLFIANPAKADSINFFIDFLNADPTLGTMFGRFKEVDSSLKNTVDQSELTSLMVMFSSHADFSSFSLTNPKYDVRYFSYDLPPNMIAELGLASGTSSAVMNFSGSLAF